MELKNKMTTSWKGGKDWILTIVSQLSKCLKFMTIREGYFVIYVEYKYLSETLETFYHRQFYRR